MKTPLIILTGPTAAGKTELSLKLAKAVNGEIISADSMQVYKGMDVGTAKISLDEMQGIPHHLINIIEPDEAFNVAVFKELAEQAVKDIVSRGRLPIITGGTGFYIQALLYDIDFTGQETDAGYRRELEQLAAEKGGEYLHNMLKEIDPDASAAIHANNVKRIIRALEFYRQTGRCISRHNEEERSKTSPYNFAYFVLNRNREELYNRINIRVDQMLENGMVDEVLKLKSKGYSRSMVSMQGLGYKEILAWLDNEISFEEAVRILKRDTRHFAKRQITWFKREREVIWLDADKPQEETLSEILTIIKEQLFHGDIDLSKPGYPAGNPSYRAGS